MNENDEASLENYPHGRGYGHDYMRGGEVLGASQDDAFQLSPEESDEAETT